MLNFVNKMKFLIYLYLLTANQTKQGRLRTSGGKKSIFTRVSTAAGIALTRLFQTTTSRQSNRLEYSTGNASANLPTNLEGKKGKDTTKTSNTSDVTLQDNDQKVQAKEPSVNADIRNIDKGERGGHEKEFFTIRPEELEEGDLDKPLSVIVSTKSIDGFMQNVASYIGSLKGSARVAAVAEREVATKNEQTQP